MVSMIEKYVSNNYRDAAEKMNGVIATFKGDWVYIGHWKRESPVADVNYIDNAKAHNRDMVDFSRVDARDFSFGPYVLGFCVADDDLYYVSRDPVRKNKFGLRDDNMSWTLVASPNQIEERLRNNPFSTAWRQGGLYNMLSGNYDGLNKALHKFQELKTLYAPISRDFALVRVGLRLCSLYYKTEQVGEVDLTTKKINLYPSFDHLQERVDRTVLGT